MLFPGKRALLYYRLLSTQSMFTGREQEPPVFPLRVLFDVVISPVFRQPYVIWGYVPSQSPCKGCSPPEGHGVCPQYIPGGVLTMFMGKPCKGHFQPRSPSTRPWYFPEVGSQMSLKLAFLASSTYKLLSSQSSEIVCRSFVITAELAA